MTAGAPELLAWLRDRTAEMVALLERLALAESPSDDVASQTVVRATLDELLSELGFATERVPGSDRGDVLVARTGGAGSGRQLLLGHLDTVWPLGTIERMPVEARNGALYGPGVFDMKGGLAQMVFAIAALRELGIEPACETVVLINADEELSSPESRAEILARADGADRVFVMEPSAGPAGDLKTARKGVGRFTLTVTGVASHAGLDPEAGHSAILEVSHQIQRLFALNDPANGVTVNVGTIDGGMRPNVIAPEATAQIEARVATAADAERVEEHIRGLAPATEGVTLEVDGGFRRPPLERTPRNRVLWEQAREAAGGLGLEIGEALVGGASDGNLASLHAATLDGLGAVGDGAHAEHEHVIVERMPERAALLAVLLAAEVRT
ncbi:MAG: M20 family metallopeptidase [Solirubrobacterales bacterium]